MIYISILRGINVAGQKKIKMADLKALYEDEGFDSVITYIQSGNVIFASENKDKNYLRTTIEKSIEKKYNFPVIVDIRTGQELSGVIKSCPYDEAELDENGTKVLVSFFLSRPLNSKILEIQKYVEPPEELTIRDCLAYIYCPNGYGCSRLSNTFLERKLGVSVTTRNWKTVRKLYELSSL